MKEIDNIYIVYLDDKSIAGVDYIKKKDELDNLNQVVRVLLGVYEYTTHDNELAKFLGDEQKELRS